MSVGHFASGCADPDLIIFPWVTPCVRVALIDTDGKQLTFLFLVDLFVLA